MKFTIITAFPEVFEYLNHSIPKRAAEAGVTEYQIINLMDFGSGKWNKIDDKPFGGGHGMLMQVEPIYKALKSIGVYPKESLPAGRQDARTKIVLTSARGKNWNQAKAENFSTEIDHLIIICGHYEGVDYRVIEHLIDEEVSIGNYILSGGELAAMVIVDSIVRLIPGSLGNEESAIKETTFDGDLSAGLSTVVGRKGKKTIEHPQYTRPEVFETEEGESWGVPDVLLSGHHKKIEDWKLDNSKEVEQD